MPNRVPIDGRQLVRSESSSGDMMSVPGSNGVDAHMSNNRFGQTSVLSADPRAMTHPHLLMVKWWLMCFAVLICVLIAGCSDPNHPAKEPIARLSLPSSDDAPAATSPIVPQSPAPKSGSISVRTVSVTIDQNSPAARRAILMSSLQASTPKRSETTLVQAGQAVPIPVLPQTPGSIPSQNQVPIELIPTPKGVPDDKEKPLDNQTVPGSPDERMAKTPDSTKQATAAPPNETKPAPDTPKKTAKLGPVTFTTWKKPDVTLFITGQQNGYIEPCGCTGLDKQKGGVARRMTFMNQLREKDWNLVPIDAGNQIRRIGQQATIKFGWSTEALKKMKYETVGFGPDDLRLNSIDLLQVCAADDPSTALYVGGNVVLFGDESYTPPVKIVEKNGMTIGITTILDPKKIDFPLNEDVVVKPTTESAVAALALMAQADFKVICFYGEEDAAKQMMQKVSGYDLIIAAGGYGEPHYEPQLIDRSETKLIDTGYKGMYAGLVGLYKDSAFEYCRVPLTHEYEDAPAMRTLMGDYQEQLESIGLEGLGLEPSPHLSGDEFVGTATCGKCHTEALETWEGTPHADATASIVKPPEERGDVARHFDPECLSCHVTGWNPQQFTPYKSGYVALEVSKHLHGNGCENCHGPGKKHSDAEQEGSGASEAEKLKYRKSIQLPLEKAKEQCMKCHDLDNSPDFHTPDAFEDVYWPEVEHYGLD